MEAWGAGQPDLLRSQGNTRNQLRRVDLYVSLNATTEVGWLDDEGNLIFVDDQTIDLSDTGNPYEMPETIRDPYERNEAPLERLLCAPQLPHLIVEGDPGAGKTVLLEHVALVLACEHLKEAAPRHALDLGALRGERALAHIPVFLKASALGALQNPQGIQRVTDAVCAEFKAVNGHAPDRDFVLQGLIEGRYLVMVDALDEVPSQEQRDDVLANLRALAANDTFHLRTILTTRPTEFTGISLNATTRGRMRELRIAPLDDERSGAMMARWCEAHQKDARYQAEMSAAIHEAGRKHAARFSGDHRANFLENPMLLTSAMLVYLGQGGLPEDTVSLYKDMVDILCKGRKHGLPHEARQEVLKLLAEILQTRRVTRLDLEQVAEAFLGYRWRPVDYPDLPAITDLFLELGDQTGLLRFESEQVDERRTRRVVRFWHRSFQEYLCAHRLAAQDIAVREQVDRLLQPAQRCHGARCDDLAPDAPLPPPALDPAWEGVLRFLTGVYSVFRGGEVCRTFLTRLHEQYPTQDTRHHAHLLGLIAHGVADYHHQFEGHDLRSKLPEELAARFQADGQRWPIEARLMALDALGRLGDPRLALDRLWVEIPAGHFIMGDDPQRGRWTGDKLTATPVSISAFQLAWRPVTVHDFAVFIKANGYKNPKWWTRGWTPDEAAPRDWDSQRHHPSWAIVGVNWFEAMAFCAWATVEWGVKARGHRVILPTEAQWEYAARGPHGPHGSFFPWGNDEPEQGEDPHANFKARVGHPSPVGAYPRGARGPLYDLAGNVWEWCFDTLNSNPVDHWLTRPDNDMTTSTARYDNDTERMKRSEKSTQFDNQWSKKIRLMMRFGVLAPSAKVCRMEPVVKGVEDSDAAGEDSRLDGRWALLRHAA